MVELLNAIIKTGGTTAHQALYSSETLLEDYIDSEHGISCVVAEIDGQIVGFQSLEWPDPEWKGPDSLPENWGIIATFVRTGMTGSGIGAAMFLDTEMAAANSGIEAIDATIRADNIGGLKYYTKMGFVDYKTQQNVPLDDGTRVDRVSKKFTL